jgi:hypothetical protein
MDRFTAEPQGISFPAQQVKSWRRIIFGALGKRRYQETIRSRINGPELPPSLDDGLLPRFPPSQETRSDEKIDLRAKPAEWFLQLAIRQNRLGPHCRGYRSRPRPIDFAEAPRL